MVSVVIPVKNAQETLKETLDSIQRQTMQAFEVIVVDDGSIDTTPILLKDYQQKDPRISAFQTNGRGPAEARNRGMRECKGKYLYFMDADDTISP
ncbi:MAG: glycosyltransferase family 2 protein, partial [Clostridium sp.]